MNLIGVYDTSLGSTYQCESVFPSTIYIRSNYNATSTKGRKGNLIKNLKGREPRVMGGQERKTDEKGNTENRISNINKIHKTIKVLETG